MSFFAQICPDYEEYLSYNVRKILVIAGVIPDNTHSIGLIEKLGFQYEGLKHKALWNEMRGPVDLRYDYLEKPVSAGSVTG